MTNSKRKRVGTYPWAGIVAAAMLKDKSKIKRQSPVTSSAKVVDRGRVWVRMESGSKMKIGRFSGTSLGAG